MIESLERRNLMAVDCAFCDVNTDGFVTPADALQVINHLNVHGAHRDTVFGGIAEDVTYDRWITPADVLAIVNYLNYQPPLLSRSLYVPYTITSTDVVGYDSEQIRRTIQEAVNEFSEHGDVSFIPVSSPSSARAEIQALVNEGQLDSGTIAPRSQHFFFGTKTLYFGAVIGHASGQQDGDELWLHNGVFPPFTHSGLRTDYFTGERALGHETLRWKWAGNISVVKSIVMHEVYHRYFGAAHDPDRNCIMHAGAVAKDWCSDEIRTIQRRWGVAA